MVGFGQYLVEQAVVADRAVALDSSVHEGLDVNHSGPAGLEPDHVEALPDQVMSRDEGGILALAEAGGLAAPAQGQDQDEDKDLLQHGETGTEENRD